MEMADPNENPSHLTLPANQAALAPFPPNCPVLVNVGGESSGGETYLGQIHSVYIDLSSATRDNFYRVRPSASAPAEVDSDLRSVPESALKYATGCTVAVDASALPPFVAEGGGNTRDATVVSCVSGGSSRYYLLDVAPGPDDSWTNIQSTVPADTVRYRGSTEEASDVPAAQPAVPPAAAAAAAAGAANDLSPARIISPHPHTIPADEDGSLNSSLCAPPVPSIIFDTDANESRKRSAGQLEDHDGGSSTLSPMPTDSSISVASKDAISEEVVRRINIADSVDASKVKEVLIGPDFKVKQRMQAKFHVTISILGLEDVIGPPPDGVIALEPFTKLGPIAFKAGDKCVMIRGSNRKVHDAAKVVIHMLANKCYDGDDKDALTRELRVVRQVRKKAESLRETSASLPPPTKKVKTGPSEGLDARWSPPRKKVKTGDAGSVPLPADKPPQRAPRDDAQHNNAIVDHSGVLGHRGGGGSSSTATPPRGALAPLDERRKFFIANCSYDWTPDDIRTFFDQFGKVNHVHMHRHSSKHRAHRGCGFLYMLDDHGDAAIDQLITTHKCTIEMLGRQQVHIQRNDGDRERGGRSAGGGASVVIPSHGPYNPMQLMGEPVRSRLGWAVQVHSPLDAQPLFHVIVGEGGVNKKKLTRVFPNAYFTIAGRGVRSINGIHSDEPLHVLVEAPDHEYSLKAASHVAAIVSDAAGSSSA